MGTSSIKANVVDTDQPCYEDELEILDPQDENLLEYDNHYHP